MKTNGQTRQPSVDNIPTLVGKRHQWFECLYGDDPNSVGYQVYVLLRDFLSWWTINEARRAAPRDENGEVQGFALLHGLLNRCFATSQMVAVRRLCDSSYGIDDPRRGVWSLCSLLADLINCASDGRFTRRVVFVTERLRHDLESLEREAQRAVCKSEIGPLVELAGSRRRHEDVDLLAGVTSDNRSADDCVRPEVFRALKDRLETTCKDICKKVSSFLAHAGTPETRKGLLDDSSQVTPNDLLRAATVIKDTFDFLSNVVLPRPPSHDNLVPMGCMTISAVEIFDPLEHIDQPSVLTQDIPKVRCIRDEMKSKLSERKDPRNLLATLGLL